MSKKTKVTKIKRDRKNKGNFKGKNQSKKEGKLGSEVAEQCFKEKNIKK